jgi:DNA adenine methylase
LDNRNDVIFANTKLSYYLYLNYSPLRYPGGKACLSNFIADIISLNGVRGGTYLELYAGGAGAALNLLFDNVVRHIHINDFDYHVYAMWHSLLNHPRAFINRINRSDVTIEEWRHQKQIFDLGARADLVDLGYATFFLNRTNRSGILLKAGPIGGFDQTGNYKIDVRFNKNDLIRRIKTIASRRGDITLTNLDAQEVLTNLQHYHRNTQGVLLYLDPPYYKKGKNLYMNNYKHGDHLQLSKTIDSLPNNLNWLISYDNVKEIKDMYRNYRMSTFNLSYTVQNKKVGSELLVFSDNLLIPDYITVDSRRNELILIEE